MAQDVNGSGGQKFTVAIGKHGAKRWDQERRQFQNPVAAVPRPGAGANRDGTPPKLALRLEEQCYGIAAHDYAFTESGGFNERGGSGEQPERNVRGFAMQVLRGGVAGRRAVPEHRGDFPVALA